MYAIDVGYGQIDWRLRNSEKVVLFERTNARETDTNIIPELLDLVVCDEFYFFEKSTFTCEEIVE